jgi:hypothetical protein
MFPKTEDSLGSASSFGILESAYLRYDVQYMYMETAGNQSLGSRMFEQLLFLLRAHPMVINDLPAKFITTLC